MTIRRVVLPLMLAIGCRFSIADTLLLKNGQKIEGRYLSSTADSVQFAVDGKPFSYSTWLINEIQFHSGVNQPVTQPTIQPQPYTGPRGKQQHRAARLSLSSPLAQKLRDTLPGGIYRVSGHLFPRNHATKSQGQTDSRQRFEGAQSNAVANVISPQYLVQFTDITPAGH